MAAKRGQPVASAGAAGPPDEIRPPIGMELKGHSPWIYLQTKMSVKQFQTSLSNALLFDFFPDQVNIVNIHNHGKKTSLAFKRGDQEQEIP